jgi:3-oxoadipate enol-lactonase
MSFIIANHITLHYLTSSGHSGTPLVFINSLGTNLHLWDAVISCLPSQLPLVRYDKRGHGLSDTPPAPYTIRDHSEDLASFLEQLKIESAIVIGISVGGLIAMDYAIRHPNRVQTLILSDTSPRIGTADGWSERIQTIRERGLAGMVTNILDRWFAPTFKSQEPAIYQGFANMLLQTPVEGYIGTCAALRDADLHETVRQINAPSLILCGARDISTPPNLMSDLAEMLPNARFQVIEDAGHLPCVEQPKTMAMMIQQFLQEAGNV